MPSKKASVPAIVTSVPLRAGRPLVRASGTWDELEARAAELGDSYLELVGVFDPALAAQGWFGPPVLATLERGGGLATWAIAVDDLESQLRWAP